MESLNLHSIYQNIAEVNDKKLAKAIIIGKTTFFHGLQGLFPNEKTN